MTVRILTAAFFSPGGVRFAQIPWGTYSIKPFQTRQSAVTSRQIQGKILIFAKLRDTPADRFYRCIIRRTYLGHTNSLTPESLEPLVNPRIRLRP